MEHERDCSSPGVVVLPGSSVLWSWLWGTGLTAVTIYGYEVVRVSILGVWLATCLTGDLADIAIHSGEHICLWTVVVSWLLVVVWTC